MGKEPETEYSVSHVTRMIRAAVEDRIAPLWVSGEVSNLARPRSGHLYMTLKDASSQLSAVMWRATASRLRFEIEDGQAVRAFGRITVYEPRGQVQMVIERVEPKGVGALELAFRQLHQRLKKEGLFDEKHKQPIPYLPGTIGIITSPTGAAIRDMLNVIHTRFPKAHVVVRGVRVQGKGAAKEIAAAIEAFNRAADVDVMIIGRGGGSLEDLWAFNEEVLARAVFASSIPVISAVGHEIDITISDLVADLRALTPTDAGVKVVPVYDELIETLRADREAMERALRNALDRARQRVDEIARRPVLADAAGPVRQVRQRLNELSARAHAALRFIARHNRGRFDACAARLRIPAARLRESRGRLDALGAALAAGLRSTTAIRAERLKVAQSKLNTLSPLAVLARGYSITTLGKNGPALTDAADAALGAVLQTRLHRGSIVSRTTRITERKDGKEENN